MLAIMTASAPSSTALSTALYHLGHVSFCGKVFMATKNFLFFERTYFIPSESSAGVKFSPSKFLAFVASLKPRYTASAPLSTAALSDTRFPAGDTTSGLVIGEKGCVRGGFY